MKWIAELINKLFPRGTRIKVDPDHLPGLRAPTSRPRIPPRPKPPASEASDIQGMYDRFQAMGVKPKSKGQHNRGIGW